jgi:SagB-type dehydrogenase family enzyme
MILKIISIFLVFFFSVSFVSAAEFPLTVDGSFLGEETAEDTTFEHTVYKRRSMRSYTEKSLSFDGLSRLLYFTYGITTDEGKNLFFRAAPSAGACYPIDLFIAVRDVKGLADGIYIYDVLKNSLRAHRAGSFQGALAKACYDQSFIAEAHVVIACVAKWSRTLTRYGKRGYRYVYMDAGHIAQNAYLEATYLDLKPCAIGSFDDVELNRIFNVDGKEQTVIYLISVGV